jgi:hypothetical protein
MITNNFMQGSNMYICHNKLNYIREQIPHCTSCKKTNHIYVHKQ